MSNELTVIANNWMQLRATQDAAATPYAKDISLCSVRIDGMLSVEDAMEKSIGLDSGRILQLKASPAESKNPCVRVFVSDSDELGYIGGQAGEICRNLLLAGKKVTAKVISRRLFSGFCVHIDVSIILNDE